jgi:hypothetical protein
MQKSSLRMEIAANEVSIESGNTIMGPRKVTDIIGNRLFVHLNWANQMTDRFS